jgi:hypothetical protein
MRYAGDRSANKAGNFISSGLATSGTPAPVLITRVYCVNDGYVVNMFLVYFNDMVSKQMPSSSYQMMLLEGLQIATKPRSYSFLK